VFSWCRGRCSGFSLVEMGQLLGSYEFMESLPVPQVLLLICAGIKDPRGGWLTFDDDILSLSKVQLGAFPVQLLAPTIHTIIMNSRQVANEIVATIK